jgi:hypothetical protein
MIRTSAVGIASMNDLTDASGATFETTVRWKVLGYWRPTCRDHQRQVSLRSATTARLSDFRSALPLLHTDPRISPFVEAFESNDPILHWSWAAEE